MQEYLSIYLSIDRSIYIYVPHPDIFWAYRFLEIKDWIV